MDFLRNLSVTARLFLGFGLSLSLGLLITAAGFFGFHQVAQSKHRLEVYGTMYDETVATRDGNFAYALEHDEESIKSHDEAIGNIRDAIREMQKDIDQSGHYWDANDREWIATLLKEVEQYAQDHKSLLARGATQDISHEIFQINERVTALQEYINLYYNAESEALVNTLSRSEWLLAVTTLAALLMGLAMAYLIARQITVPLREALQVGQKIAAGDLSVMPTRQRQDELGELSSVLASIVSNFRQMIGKIRDSSDHMLETSTGIVNGSARLSSRTEQQAAAIEQTASTMEELVATVRNTSDSTEQANRVANEVSERALRSSDMMRQTTQSMTEISQSSERMSQIIHTIEGIAFQTNILALNASVEAARAGEQGRGFAVVAGEVRSLAQRSDAAAKEIKALIDCSVQRIREGSTQVESTNSVMQQMVSDVERIKTLLMEIARASREQSDGIQQTNSAVAQIEASTQENAALVDESSKSAAALERQAEELADAIAVFHFTDGTHTRSGAFA